MSQNERGGTPKRALAALAVSAIALLGAVGASTPAFAAPELGGIDPNASGSIIVHKHEHQTGTTPVTKNPDGSGDEILTPGIKDVTFTAYPLLKGGAAIDLNDPAAWDQLADLTAGADCTAPSGYELGTALAPAVTGDDGTATIPTDVGVYVVCETDAPAQVVDRAAPFIVTVPYPFEGTWLTDVHVYPKNGVTSVSKTINAQQGLGLGSTVEFPVTVKVPALAAGRTFSSFDIADTLDSRLTPSPAANGVGVGIKSITVDGTPVTAANFGIAASGQTVTLSFTPAAGLDYLRSLAGKEIVVTFQATVTKLGDGVIENTAFDSVNNKKYTTNKVTTNWGDVVVKKVDAKSNATLAGAKFEVYAAADPYAADCTNATATGSALQVDGESEFTTQSNGQVTIPGLFVSDSENDTKNAAQRCYVLKETAAPAGYVTPTGAAALFPVAVKTGATAGVDVTVENVQQKVPGLPLTGSAGALMLSVAGGALLIAAVGTGLIVSRRRTARAE